MASAALSVFLTPGACSMASGTLLCTLLVSQPHSPFPKAILFDVFQKVAFLQICKNIIRVFWVFGFFGFFSKEMLEISKKKKKEDWEK